MKKVELLKILAEGLKMLSESEVMMNDYRYVPLYEAFMNMRSSGVKYRSVVRMLAEEYHISRATVERIVRRLDGEC
jgi:hypothetical protein